MTQIFRTLALCTLALSCLPASAQISFTTAVDLALRNNPRVMMAQADVDKARAALAESRDAYIPTLTVGSGLGESYGFPIGQPSIFNSSSQSLIYNSSQRDYIRAALASLTAANFSLQDEREAAAEDAAITYMALDRDNQRLAALNQQFTYANNLVRIVQERLDAGQDTAMSLTQARLTAAQIKLDKLHAEDAAEMDMAHLAGLMGLPAQGLALVHGSIPPFPSLSASPPAPQTTRSPSVESAYANAEAKQEVAFGDARYLWRPQISFVAQYSLFSTTINNYQSYYLNYQPNNAAIGVQLSLPIFDPVHRAKARESAADAVHARREADFLLGQMQEGRIKAQHSTLELAAKVEVATLDQQLAQQQLDIMLIQIKNGTGTSGAPMTPKDEQTARIAERNKYLSVLDTAFQMDQAEMDLLRKTGELEPWLKSAAQSQIPPDQTH